jgi:hypothetical protein
MDDQFVNSTQAAQLVQPRHVVAGVRTGIGSLKNGFERAIKGVIDPFIVGNERVFLHSTPSLIINLNWPLI